MSLPERCRAVARQLATCALTILAEGDQGGRDRSQVQALVATIRTLEHLRETTGLHDDGYLQVAECQLDVELGQHHRHRGLYPSEMLLYATLLSGAAEAMEDYHGINVQSVAAAG